MACVHSIANEVRPLALSSNHIELTCFAVESAKKKGPYKRASEITLSPEKKKQVGRTVVPLADSPLVQSKRRGVTSLSSASAGQEDEKAPDIATSIVQVPVLQNPGTSSDALAYTICDADLISMITQ